VDEACKTIQEKEDNVNLLFMTAEIFTTKGPDGTFFSISMKLSASMGFTDNIMIQKLKKDWTRQSVHTTTVACNS
jgi:hypothetical protein